LTAFPVGDARFAGIDRLPERYFRLREGVLQFGDPRFHPIGRGAGGEENRGGGRDQKVCSLITALLSAANPIHAERFH
jgi:hypothetical protein